MRRRCWRPAHWSGGRAIGSGFDGARAFQRGGLRCAAGPSVRRDRRRRSGRARDRSCRHRGLAARARSGASPGIAPGGMDLPARGGRRGGPRAAVALHGGSALPRGPPPGARGVFPVGWPVGGRGGCAPRGPAFSPSHAFEGGAAGVGVVGRERLSRRARACRYPRVHAFALPRWLRRCGPRSQANLVDYLRRQYLRRPSGLLRAALAGRPAGTPRRPPSVTHARRQRSSYPDASDHVGMAPEAGWQPGALGCAPVPGPGVGGVLARSCSTSGPAASS